MKDKIRNVLATSAAKKVAAVLITVGLGAVGYQIDPAACDALVNAIVGVLSL